MRSSSYVVCFSHFLCAATVSVISFHWLSSVFLQHCHYQHPPHEGCMSALIVTPLALIDMQITVYHSPE